VPAFADYCVTYAADAQVIRPLGMAHRDPANVPLVEKLVHSHDVNIDDAAGPGMVIRLGEPSMTDASAAVPELDTRSVMTVPLKARGRTLGAIVLAAIGESGRRFGEADLEIAMELASRAALLVDNARLYAEARTAVRWRDEMVAFVSHDLRSPLQSISAATAMLQREPQPAESIEDIETIARASTQMERLVQDLLDVSTIEAGRLFISREPVDLPDLIAELQMLVSPQVRAGIARLETRLARDLPQVSLDRHRILEVLLNLIGNAFKFGTPGGLVIVGAERQADAVRIWVRDTGAGISPEQLPRVFDRFWRLDRRAGAGLGLAVAKGIVEAHGGQIDVTSQLGIGSTFFFTLPVQSGADVSRARDARPTRQLEQQQPSRSQRVLVVDDDPDVVHSLARLVRSLGHTVHIALSGEDALEVAEAVRPDIVLMDIGLPGLSGYDTARELRAQAWASGVILIALTGLARDADRLRALGAGFDLHIAKPVDADVLETLLNAPANVARA
jgi:signal transduction histidine kinase/CheY-like chemotaxis protein